MGSCSIAIHRKATPDCESDFTACQKTQDYGKVVIASLVTGMHTPGPSTKQFGLLGGVGNAHGMTFADKMAVFGFGVAVGDLVSRRGRVGSVVACCETSTDLFAIVQPLHMVHRRTPHAAIYMRIDGNLEAWLAAELCTVLAWMDRTDGTTLVLRE